MNEYKITIWTYEITIAIFKPSKPKDSIFSAETKVAAHADMTSTEDLRGALEDLIHKLYASPEGFSAEDLSGIDTALAELPTGA